MDKKEEIKRLKKEKNYEEIYRTFGSKEYVKNTPSSYRKKDLNKLVKEGNLIEEFIDKKSFDAMQTLVSTLKDDEAKDSAVQLANVFGAGESFKKIANSEPEAEKKLIQSFHNNL